MIRIQGRREIAEAVITAALCAIVTGAIDFSMRRIDAAVERRERKAKEKESNAKE